MTFEKKPIADRKFQSYREANGNLTKVAVDIENSDENAIPVYQSYGDFKNLFNETTTIPNSDVSVLSYTVIEPILKIISIKLSCHIEGKMTFLLNGNKIAVSRTGPGKPDAEINYLSYLKVVSGDEIEVKFKARPNSAIAEVESFINAYT